MNTSTKLSASQKGFVPILIIILLTAVLVGGYLVYQNQPKPTPSPQPTTQPYPTSDPTASWKTYECTNIYSLKYPKDWFLWPQGHGACRGISLTSTTRVPALSPDCYEGVDGQIPHPKTWSDTVAGYKAYVRFWNGAPDGIQEPHYRQTIYLLKPGALLTCAFDLLDTPSQQYSSIFNQILSTFKFLDQENPEGNFCGGIAANLPENQCPPGYTCKLDGNYPDASGKCVKD